MTAEEMWKLSGLIGEYDAWSFGSDPDRLAALVKNGVKTANFNESLQIVCEEFEVVPSSKT